jgi:hypothetical protein
LSPVLVDNKRELPMSNTEQQYKPGDTANGHILGEDGVWHPVPQGEAPKKNWFARHKVITGIGGGVIALILIGNLGGGDDDKTIEQVASDAVATQEADAATDEAPADEAAAEEPTSEPEPEPVVEEADGSFANPYPFGTKVGDDEVTLVLGKVETKGVTQMVKSANMFNDDPKPGNVYLRVPVTLTNTGEDKVNPAWDVDITLVAKSGETYNDAFIVGDELKRLGSFDDLYPGGKAKGYVYFDAPASAAKGALIEVAAGFWNTDETLVKAS